MCGIGMASNAFHICESTNGIYDCVILRLLWLRFWISSLNERGISKNTTWWTRFDLINFGRRKIIEHLARGCDSEWLKYAQWFQEPFHFVTHLVLMDFGGDGKKCLNQSDLFGLKRIIIIYRANKVEQKCWPEKCSPKEWEKMKRKSIFCRVKIMNQLASVVFSWFHSVGNVTFPCSTISKRFNWLLFRNYCIAFCKWLGILCRFYIDISEFVKLFNEIDLICAPEEIKCIEPCTF